MTKNALFRYFWGRILKKYCNIWIQQPQFSPTEKFFKKTKTSKLGTKNTLFRYIWGRFLKNYCHIWNQYPQICVIAKFCTKIKMPNFGTKYHWLGIFGIEF